MVAKRMFARMLAAALVALALVPAVAATALADEDFWLDGSQYTINAGGATVTVSKAPPNISGAVTIPATVMHEQVSYTVTAIGEHAFEQCANLESVEIPASVTSIGEYAFAYCESLGSVGIPASVTSIGEGAFRHCTSLGSVEIPASVTNIGKNAFNGCTNLSSVDFEQDSQLVTIGDGAFLDCRDLESIDIPASVRGIGTAAFSGTGLTFATLPEGLENISNSLFKGCGSLTRVVIPSTVTRIRNSVFSGCSALSKVDFGGSRLQWDGIDWWGGNPGIEPVSFGKFDVTFDSRGGGEVAPQVVAPGGTAAEPQAPTKDGVHFAGWYSDEAPTSPFDFSTSINEDLALHAVYRCVGDHQWEQKVQKATPTSDGRVYKECGVCGAEQDNVPLPKVGTIKLAKASFTYTGKAVKPAVTVADADGALPADCYTVSYSNNVGAGTATAKVTLKGDRHEGSKTLEFTIAKAANTLSAKAKSKKAVPVKVGKSLKAKKLFRVSKAQGKVTYKKAKGSKKITVAKNGKVSVKKGCKKGTYALTVKVRAAGNANYKASKWKAVKVKVKVG